MRQTPKTKQMSPFVGHSFATEKKEIEEKLQEKEIPLPSQIFPCPHRRKITTPTMWK